MLAHLNSINDVPIKDAEDDSFRIYGRIITGYDFSALTAYMQTQTQVPASNNSYVPSDAAMEATDIFTSLTNTIYGGMPIQIGYCNGNNTTYNGFEYHKGSEINIAVTDYMLVLGHVWDIDKNNNTYHVDNAEVFYIQKGCAIELYQTTLHLAPLKVHHDGFKAIVILPRGTNLPFEQSVDSGNYKNCVDKENALLLHQNKWVLAHPEREALISQGAFPGVLGPNKALNY